MDSKAGSCRASSSLPTSSDFRVLNLETRDGRSRSRQDDDSLTELRGILPWHSTPSVGLESHASWGSLRGLDHSISGNSPQWLGLNSHGLLSNPRPYEGVDHVEEGSSGSGSCGGARSAVERGRARRDLARPRSRKRTSVGSCGERARSGRRDRLSRERRTRCDLPLGKKQ
jgi:hypothetical protein